jgi:hypothetical protein
VSWKDAVSLCVLLLGVVLFVYGANSYDATAGWTGVFLALAGLLALLVLRMSSFLAKHGS